jgi:hypothetical protein
MGCHTWFYKKLNSKEEELKKEILFKLYELRKTFIKNKKLLSYITNDIFKIKNKKMSKKFLYKIYVNIPHDNLKTIFNNNIYEKVNEFHDLFRTNDYNSPILISFEETLNFINLNNLKGISYFSEEEKRIITEEPDFKKIKEFWNKYPDGIIEFG